MSAIARITQALARNPSHPTTALGACLDAASAAEQRLRSAPDDVQARADYNFATGRVFAIIHDARLSFPFGVKGAMKAADRSGARFAVVVGERDLAAGVAQVKDLRNGQQAEVPVADLVAELERLVGEPERSVQS